MTTPAAYILAAVPIETKEDEFWGLNPGVLWADTRRMLQFVPSQDMSRDECYNALTRFFLYLGILTALNKNQTRYFLMWGIFPVIVLYTVWHYENPEHSFGTIFRLPHWIRQLLPFSSRQEQFTTLTDFKPSLPVTESKGNCRLPRPGNPYANPLRTMWGSREATLDACNYLESPAVAAEIDGLQSDWYNNLPGDLYQNQQGQRNINFCANPGSLVPDWSGKTRDWLYRLPEGYKTQKEGGNHASILTKNGNLGPQSKDPWQILQTT